MIVFDGLGERLEERVTERFDEFRLRYSGEINATELRLVMLAVCQFVLRASSRDRCGVRVEHAGDPIPMDISSLDGCVPALEALDCTDSDVYASSVEITIEKFVRDQTVSVYSVDAFASYLTEGPLQDVTQTLASRMAGKLLLECQNETVHGGTRTIRFAPTGEDTSFELVDEPCRLEALGLFRDTSHTDVRFGSLIPADVGLREKTGIDRLDWFFSRLGALVAVSYLANHTWIDEGVIRYRMAGYKVLDGTVSAEEFASATPALVQIAQWCYADGGQSDKIGLARNVISIHADHLWQLGSKPEVWHALLSNYQIYLKQNVESYLALKARLSDMLMDASERTQALAGSVLEALRNSIYVLLTFLLTVVVVNAVKDMSVAAVFSTPYLVIAVITCLLLSAWVGAAAWHALNEYDSGTKALEQVVVENYGTMLSAGELTSVLRPASVRNRLYLVSNLRRHIFAWSGIVLLLLTSLVLAHIFFDSARQGTSSSSLSDATGGTEGAESALMSRSSTLSDPPWLGVWHVQGSQPLTRQLSGNKMSEAGEADTSRGETRHARGTIVKPNLTPIRSDDASTDL